MKEIGGYIGLETFSGEEYYTDLLRLNSARNAMRYLLRARQIGKLYIPFNLCGCIAQICGDDVCPFEYYHTDERFLPEFDKKPGEAEYLLVVNYYGQIDQPTVQSLKVRYGNIILDNTQAFFQRPIPGVDTFYSCRKYFGVPDGSYLSTEARLPEALETDISGDRMRHLLGRFEETAEKYYPRYVENENGFDVRELRAMSELTRNLLRAIDYDRVRERRTANFSFLHENLKSRNRLELTIPEGPFAYPLYSEDGPELRKRLAQEKIYVPLLWPDAAESDRPMERNYMQNILPLPCDQRYGPADMERILAAINQ